MKATEPQSRRQSTSIAQGTCENYAQEGGKVTPKSAAAGRLTEIVWMPHPIFLAREQGLPLPY
jgi:hypothetical protein